MKEVTLFEPNNKDLRIEYPELAQIKEFESLDSSEMKFVWLIANPSSPLYHITEKRKKYALCVTNSLMEKLTEEQRTAYASGVLPEKIRVAMEKMSKFSISNRYSAKMTTEIIFLNLQSMVVLSEEEKNAMDGDFEKKKQYSTLAISVAAAMPEIVVQMEEGFGIRLKEKQAYKDGKKPASIMDLIHQEEE